MRRGHQRIGSARAATPVACVTTTSEWAPDLEVATLPLRTAEDELRAYELGATIALSAPDEGSRENSDYSTLRV
jgi:hypothetical protein